MDMKSAFLNALWQEEVYVAQPKGFVNLHHSNHVFKLKKELYGPKQAPQAWHERLTTYLLVYGLFRGQTNQSLFTKGKLYSSKLDISFSVRIV